MQRTAPLRTIQSSGARQAAILVTAALAVSACQGGNKNQDNQQTPPGAAPTGSAAAAASPSASAPKGVVVGVPVPPDKVAKEVNPNGVEPYSGPSGTIKGVIRIKGDPPPATDFSFPSGCAEGASTYGKWFRVGQDGTVADVLVAATGYDGYVPPREEAVKVTLRGCAMSSRTVAATFGQRIEVKNIDKTESYMPYLDGAKFRAVLVAIPGGDPVKLYPQEPGHYMIRDQLPKPFMTADVFVVKFATHAVTGLDGMYEIKGVPVGKVRVNALLPQLDITAEQMIEVKPGDNVVDLTLEFDRAKFDEVGRRKKVQPKPLPADDIGPKG
jgi:hypothetical protein